VLGRVSSPDNVKNHTYVELEQVAADIRQDAITTVLANGCHPASNIGTVKVTIALHRVFANYEDKITRGVGHQVYAREPLTGHKEEFTTAQQYSDLSRFPQRMESAHYVFDTVYAGTIVSDALGMAIARDLAGEWQYAVADIDDSTLGAGMAFKALNSADGLGRKLPVVPNDKVPSVWVQNLLWARHYGAKREETSSSERRSRV